MSILFKLWPPSEAACANKRLQELQAKIQSDEGWRKLEEDVKQAFKESSDPTAAAALSVEVASSEMRRKEVLENKASTVVQAAGVTVSIVALGPVFADNYTNLPFIPAAVASIAYVLSVIHLTVAVYYAFLVRRAHGFMLPSYDGFIDLLDSVDEALERRIALDRVLSAKFNENILSQKNNFLSVSEDLFLRGIALFGGAAVVFLVCGSLLSLA